MPVPSRSGIEIAQRACVLSGIDKISSFTDPDSEVAKALDDIYEDLVEDCLSIHPWRFATHIEPLGPPLLPTPSPSSPLGFSQAYALPTTPAPLQVRTVFVSGSLASHYKVYGANIWVDAGTTEHVEVEALWRIEEAQWPPWFRLYAILRVAGFITGSITRNGELAKTLLAEAEAQLARARNRDSVQQTTQRIRFTKIRSSRLGGRPL